MSQDPVDALTRSVPRWFRWLVVAGLLWNVLGFVAVAMNTLGAGPPLNDAQEAYGASVPIWAVAASWIAVGAGVAGCLLMLRQQARAISALATSLVAILVQDLWMFVLSDTQMVFGSMPLIMQSIVAAIAVMLLWLASHARTKGWLN